MLKKVSLYLKKKQSLFLECCVVCGESVKGEVYIQNLYKGSPQYNVCSDCADDTNIKEEKNVEWLVIESK